MFSLILGEGLAVTLLGSLLHFTYEGGRFGGDAAGEFAAFYLRVERAKEMGGDFLGDE